MSGNLVIEETGILSAGEDVTLTRFGGMSEPARGVVARLPETAAELIAAPYRSGVNVWIPPVSFASDIEFVTLGSQRGSLQGTYRVILVEEVRWPNGEGQVRLQCQNEAIQ